MIIYLDTETTGLKPGNICQLSYILQDKEKTTAKNMFFTVDFVEPSAEAVHGFSVEYLYKMSNGKRFFDRAGEIKKDFESASVLVAHNASFDFMFLGEEFSRTNLPLYAERVLCSMKTMTPYTRLPKARGLGYKYPKLSELCEFFNITDREINTDSKKLFGGELSFHDARFDTTALYLCMNHAFNDIDDLSGLKEYL